MRLSEEVVAWFLDLRLYMKAWPLTTVAPNEELIGCKCRPPH